MIELGASASGPSQAGASAQTQFANPALWRVLLDAGDAAAFSDAWLGIVAGQIDFAFGATLGGGRVVLCGIVALRQGASQRYVRLGRYGAQEAGVALARAAERCLQLRSSVVQAGETLGDACQIAVPVLEADRLHGVVALELVPAAAASLNVVARAVQWGLGWFSRMFHAPDPGALLPMQRVTLQAVALAAGPESPRIMARALCTLLAERLDVMRVSLGVARPRPAGPQAAAAATFSVGAAAAATRMQVLGTSRGRLADGATDFAIAIAAAMEEAVDAGAPVSCPALPEQAGPIGAHQRLCRSHGADWAFTLPMPSAEGDTALFALTVEGVGTPPAAADVAAWQTITQPLAPVLRSHKRATRGLWPHAQSVMTDTVAKILRPRDLVRWGGGAVAALLLAVLLLVPVTYRINTTATLEGMVKRQMIAPFDGYLVDARVRAGQRVAAGTVLARLDDRDLRLQQQEDLARVNEAQHQMDQAIGTRDLATARIYAARRAAAAAQLALVNDSIAHAALVAPFDAIVISGDPSQMLGAPLRHGDALYELSPLDAYRVALDVDQADFAAVAPGQSGNLVLTALPYTSLPIRTTLITPIGAAVDGHDAFRVEATMSQHDAALRPGMQGFAKIAVGRRSLAWIWSHDTLRWVRLKLWRFWP